MTEREIQKKIREVLIERECRLTGELLDEANVISEEEANAIGMANLAGNIRCLGLRVGGEYIISKSVEKFEQGSLSEKEKAKICRWIYEQNRKNLLPYIISDIQAENKISDAVNEIIEALLPNGLVPIRESELYKEIRKKPFPSLPERMDMYIEWFAHSLGSDLSKTTVPNATRSKAASCALNDSDHSALIQYLHESNLVQGTDIDIKLTPHGWERYREITREKQEAQSNKIFLAMWFGKKADGNSDDSMDRFYKHIKNSIEKETDYEVMRIDRLPHNNKIDDEIIAQIRDCYFVIADFTSEKDNARGGVYYEAGFAHGLDKQVIFTVREDCAEHVHFDTRQFNHIIWEEKDNEFWDINGEGRTVGEALVNRIKATIPPLE